jgi:hypothetical protein
LIIEPTTVLWSNNFICCVYGAPPFEATWTGPILSGFMTNAATGKLVTVTVFVTGELLPAAFEAIRDTV